MSSIRDVYDGFHEKFLELQAQKDKDDFAQLERAVVEAAVAWWIDQRGPGDTQEEQIAQDICYSGIVRAGGKRLAASVARLIKARSEDTRR